MDKKENLAKLESCEVTWGNNEQLKKSVRKERGCIGHVYRFEDDGEVLVGYSVADEESNKIVKLALNNSITEDELKELLFL